MIHIDTSVCLYALIASCISALIFGIIPALQAARLPILNGLREGSAGSGTSRSQALVRDTIVTVEVALSLLLLVAAGIMARTLYEMQRTPLGFNPDKVVTAELMLPQKSYWFVQAGPSKGPSIVTTLIDPMLDRISHLPGVSAAGVTTVRPLRTNWTFLDSIEFAGRPKPDPRHMQSANARAATPDYFRAMGVTLKQGRFFNQQDSVGAPLAAIVNEAFTRQIDGARSPIGMQVKMNDKGPHHYATIVGVVADARQEMNDTAKPEMLLNLDQMSPADDMYPILVAFHLDLIVRSQTEPGSLIPAINRIVHDLDPGVGVNHAELMQTSVEDTMGSQTLAARLLSLFALAALVIAAAGLYGLLAYQVTQQIRDFGVRLTVNPATLAATWSDISYDVGDQPVTGIAYDGAGGNLYISTDWGVLQLQKHGHSNSWEQAAPGLPLGAVYGITIAPSGGVMYAATHGRSAWSLDISGDRNNGNGNGNGHGH